MNEMLPRYVDPTLKFTCTKTRAQWEEEQKLA